MKHRSSLSLVIVLAFACGCSKSDNARSLPAIDAAAEVGTIDDAGGDGGEVDLRAQERRRILEVPKTVEVKLGALSEPVQVVRTAGNVPHIYASNERDLYIASGWAMARDRYFEYEMGRRLALGEVSELLGRFGIAADVSSRNRGMHIVAARILEHLDEETGALFDAFAEGINAYVDGVQAGTENPPSEYVLAAPLLNASSATELMSPADRRTVAGFAAFVVFESSFTDHDLMRTLVAEELDDHFVGDPHEELRRGGIEDLFNDTTPRHELAVSDGFGLNGELMTTRALTTRLGPVRSPTDFATTRLPEPLRERLRTQLDNWHLWFGAPDDSDRGSNSWAVAPDETADGSVLLAGDGHLALGIPTLFFQMGVDLRTFGDDPLRAMGLYLPGFPFLAVGTNGDIAWSQTYPRADVTDWYREEVRLDAEGLPAESFFAGEWRPLVQIDEEYHIAGVLTDDPVDAVYPRWTTFDDRVVVEVEGRTVEDPETEVLEPGESLVNMSGTWVVPSDLDGDGTVTAISFDFTGFDIGNLSRAIEQVQRADSVETFQEQAKDFVGYAQNLIVADRSGKIGFTPFTAMPCREYLPRLEDGRWAEGADPSLLLDGTTHQGFEVPLKPDGTPDTEAGADDPLRCLVPWDAYPRVVAESGWVVNANNDPHGGSFDGTLTNDPYYLGGPWVPGYRARAIHDGLEAVSGEADLASMAEIQAHHGSQLGEDFAPVAIAAAATAKGLRGVADAELTAAEIRLRDLYAQSPSRIDEATDRLQAWLDRGANAASGVETFYSSPGDDDRTDAVATMIFNVWLRQWIAAVFEDEEIDGLLNQPGRARGAMIRALRTLTEGKGADNPAGLASWNPETAESIFFDDRATPDIVETGDEAAVTALVAALAYLESEPLTGANGGFGTADMEQWLWGLRHRVVLDSILASFGAGNPAVNIIAKEFAIDTKVLPLAEDLADDDPRRWLRWFPRPGDYFGVDASNPSFYGDSFDYSTGPVMRMVIRLGPDKEVSGQNIVPGGQSGLNDSPYFADQAALWLGNDTLPMHWAPLDVAEGAIGREVLTP